MREKTIADILQGKIIPVARGIEKDRVIPMVCALAAGGIPCIEMTFDPKNKQSDSEVAQQVEMISEQFGEKICLGVGTVTTAEQVRLAAKTGAQFIVSPCTVPEVVQTTLELGLVSIPGAFTPTEIHTAHALSADIVKLFPASFLGTEYIGQIKGPLGGIRLMANGGISIWNMRAFLEAGCVGVGIGKNLIAEVYKPNCDFGILAETAATFRAIADNERSPKNRDL